MKLFQLRVGWFLVVRSIKFRSIITVLKICHTILFVFDYLVGPVIASVRQT